MNRTFAVLLGLAAMPWASARAADAPRSPLVGHWSLDVATLPMPPEMRPKRATLVFDQRPDGLWASQVRIVDQNDKELHAESALSLDGTPGRATGTYWVDVCAAKMPAPDVLVMQFSYQGTPTSTRVYSLGPDGNTLTETEAYFTKDGTPAMRTALFTRMSDDDAQASQPSPSQAGGP